MYNVHLTVQSPNTVFTGLYDRLFQCRGLWTWVHYLYCLSLAFTVCGSWWHRESKQCVLSTHLNARYFWSMRDLPECFLRYPEFTNCVCLKSWPYISTSISCAFQPLRRCTCNGHELAAQWAQHRPACSRALAQCHLQHRLHHAHRFGSPGSACLYPAILCSKHDSSICSKRENEGLFVLLYSREHSVEYKMHCLATTHGFLLHPFAPHRHSCGFRQLGWAHES